MPRREKEGNDVINKRISRMLVTSHRGQAISQLYEIQFQIV